MNLSAQIRTFSTQKKIILLLLSLTFALSLYPYLKVNHYNDGEYYTSINSFGNNYLQMNYNINGNEILIDNSLMGSSKIECKQYEDRIEFIDQNNSTKILYVLENGDLELSKNIILKKIKN